MRIVLLVGLTFLAAGAPSKRDDDRVVYLVTSDLETARETILNADNVFATRAQADQAAGREVGIVYEIRITEKRRRTR
jgi:hypothetical protein